MSEFGRDLDYEDGALDALDYVLDQDPSLDDLTMRAAEKIGANVLARRKRERGAVEALRLLWDDIRETDKRFIPSDVRAKVDAALAGRSTHRTEETG